MENYVEKRVKTLITLSDYENKVINIICKRLHKTKSQLISEMIEYYVKNMNWIVPKIVYQREIDKEYNNCSKVIMELREKWKKN